MKSTTLQKILPLIVLLVLTMACGSYAGEHASAYEGKTHEFEVGYETSYIEYKEDLMKEDGVMNGVSGAYTYRGRFTDVLKKIALRVEGKISYGQVDYDGQLQSGTPYTIDNIDDCMLEARGLIGYDFDVVEKTTVTPYVGVGYRYLRDDGSTDPAGYLRESNYIYSPVGLMAKKNMGKGWSIGGAVEYDHFWYGRQKSYLSDAVASLPNMENDQEKGYGVRGSIRLEKETPDFEFLIEPFIKYWDIEESEKADVIVSGTIIGTATEPENQSTEIGVKLGILF